jgi:FtsP/CotA-like multicopper oxidase with cupredoxin domain
MKKSTRREFVKQTAVAASAVALLPSSSVFAQTACPPKDTLQEIGEIKSKGKKLRGVLKIRNGNKNLPGYTGAQKPMMRFFEGYDQQNLEAGVWPPAGLKGNLLPGPTFRVGVGERVEITFLNQVDVGAFSGGTLDNAETGATTGCDEAVNGAVDPPDKRWYPGTRGDVFPNCFHASSSANLHFHGTHVTPDAFGDNVLVSVRPDPSITEDKVKAIFEEVFAQCAASHHPPKWNDVPEPFREMQAGLVKSYDLNAIWKGTRGPITTPEGEKIPALPLANQLTPANDKAIAAGHWPQFFSGAYPSCFQVTEAAGHDMGQAPGTHWYHAHKHGSTSVNLFNGLAGAFIIEGDYDRDLRKIYPNLEEKVLVVQVFTDQPNLERAGTGRAARTVVTNGAQVTATAPVIVMRPGEVQLWRIVNAQVQNTIAGAFTGPAGATLPKFRQIAQDGVQFRRENYNLQPLTTPDADRNGTALSLPAGGRMDILVQAPLVTAATTFQLTGVVNVTVCGDPLQQQFPDGSPEGNYPRFPEFLHDIAAPKLHRELSFDWEPFRIKNGPATNGTNPTHSKTVPFDVEVGNPTVGIKKITVNLNRGPYWMVDEEQFEDDKYNQTMVLDTNEEWIIYNTTSVAHPFHIHVNPFQVVEVFDPSGTTSSKPASNYVWRDVVLVPAAKNNGGKLIVGEDGKVAPENRGYVRIRSRFVDFPGTFVLHCHILAHEDRGMMQLVRVVDGTTPFSHH